MNQFDGLILRRIEIYADRVLAILHENNLLAQKLTKHNDAAVGFAEMFVGTLSNRTLRLPSHVILARKMTQMKFACVVFGGNEFHGRGGRVV